MIREGAGCTGRSMPGTRYERDCWNAPMPGTDHCYAHGARPARLVVREGRRRDMISLVCPHHRITVTFASGEEERQRQIDRLLPTIREHACYAELAVRYGRR